MLVLLIRLVCLLQPCHGTTKTLKKGQTRQETTKDKGGLKDKAIRRQGQDKDNTGFVVSKTRQVSSYQGQDMLTWKVKIKDKDLTFQIIVGSLEGESERILFPTSSGYLNPNPNPIPVPPTRSRWVADL